MKTTFRAKIIVEADPEQSKFPELTLKQIYKIIRSGKFEIEVVDDYMSRDFEPVLIIKAKP